MNITRREIVVVIMVAALGAGRGAAAQVNVQQMQGAVEVRVAGAAQWTAATQGMTLPPGSLVRTEQGAAVLSLADGTAVALWPQTTFDFRQMEYAADTKSLRLSAVLWRGQLQFNLTVSPHPESSYVVKTPNAAVTLLRAEGTIWYAKDTGTRVALRQGQARVEAMKQSVTLAANQETVVPPGAAPRPPTVSGLPPTKPNVPTPPPSTPSPTPKPAPPLAQPDADKKKTAVKERLMSVMTIIPDMMLSPEALDLEIENLQRRLNREPGDIEAHARLAALYTQRRRPASKNHPIADVDLAIQHYKIVSEANAGKALAHLNLGQAYARGGEVDKAIHEFRRAIALDPTLAAAHQWLAFVYDALGQYEAAESAYKKAIELQRTDPLIHSNYANFLSEQGRLPEAIAEMKLAIDLCRDSPYWMMLLRFQAGLAMLYLANKQLDDAIALLNRLTQESPHVAILHLFHSLALLAKGDKEAATKAFERASRADPNNPLLHYALAEMLEEQGDKQRAADHLEQFLNKLPPNYELPPGLPSIADIRDHMRVLRGLEPLQKDRGVKKQAT
ncbi:MAG: tetratricopeptide repeat protein [Abditibacteriales bacterium]|nr:tetratricopeptide repeat protein [Abditibacteriales bacterium]MDW8364330.1 tetratricopeptide repeat protein [Abditibacteriales bacterium]